MCLKSCMALSKAKALSLWATGKFQICTCSLVSHLSRYGFPNPLAWVPCSNSRWCPGQWQFPLIQLYEEAGKFPVSPFFFVFSLFSNNWISACSEALNCPHSVRDQKTWNAELQKCNFGCSIGMSVKKRRNTGGLGDCTLMALMGPETTNSGAGENDNAEGTWYKNLCMWGWMLGWSLFGWKPCNIWMIPLWESPERSTVISKA